MDQIVEFFQQLVNPESIILYGGLTLLLIVIFAETGLFFGFFLPGDSLLFTAGLLCGTEVFKTSIYSLLAGISAAAILGNMVGYWFGKKAGKPLFRRENSFFFKRSHLVTARVFYRKYGGTTLIIGRFLPIVRTFAPILAGVIEMNYARFMVYNVAGCILWVFSLVLCGFFLGKTFPEIYDHLEYIIIGLIVVTAIPVVRTLRKVRKVRPAKG